MRNQSNLSISTDTILDVVAALIVVLDPDARIVRFNAACERVTGYTTAEAIGRVIWDFLIPPEQLESTRATFAALKAGRFPNHQTNDWITKDGSRRLIEWSNTVILADEGSIQFVVATGLDISDRRRTEASLRDREERLLAVVNTAVDGIVTIDHEGIIDSFNPAAERIFGYIADEVIGKPVKMLMPAPYRENHDQYIRNYLQSGVAKIIGIGREVTGMRKDRSTFPMDLAVSEMKHLRQFVGIVRDLSDRRKAEEQLRQADRLASIGSLAAGLGHDMNNVLLPMRGRLDALEAADLPQKLRQHLRAIRDSVSYLQQLTDGLHLLAIDPRNEEASGFATDIVQWWDQVGPLLQRCLPRHVRLATSLPTGLLPVALAPHRLTQVMLNLLVNAGDAVGSDGRVRIEAEVAHETRSLKLTVSDNGVGMTPEVRTRAFDAFFTTKDRGRGTGLGLALVRGIITGAGGTIRIDSEPGRGTSVIMNLPTAAVGLLHAEAGPGTVPLAAVISIDDDRIASMIQIFLESEGFRVSRELSADPETSTLWITSPSNSDVSAVQKFLKSPRHQVIACGPQAHAWGRLGALVLEDVLDFESVRDRVARALHALDGSVP